MAKVFVIRSGLENLGGLKSGGQGSVYQAKREDGTISAVKILPTPIIGEETNHKNYQSFLSEVEKLKRVNEVPNQNVVRILSSGITESGNLPYIEMEYIDGPDLGDMLANPGNSVFTIDMVVKVALEIANALSHCHSRDVKHGDIKSNNIKYNRIKDKYVLLDFGMSLISNEQRRTSYRDAGAVEFMAPEQAEGNLYFQSDIYSFGVVIFELLAGTVPFPLLDQTNANRNHVMLAHIDRSVPDINSLRKNYMPNNWDGNKQKKELDVPGWLLEIVYKCLEKKPDNRYSNGSELLNNILKALDNSEAIEPKNLNSSKASYPSLLLRIERLEQYLQPTSQEITKENLDDNLSEELELLFSVAKYAAIFIGGMNVIWLTFYLDALATRQDAWDVFIFLNKISILGFIALFAINLYNNFRFRQLKISFLISLFSLVLALVIRLTIGIRAS